MLETGRLISCLRDSGIFCDMVLEYNILLPCYYFITPPLKLVDLLVYTCTLKKLVEGGI